MTDYHCENCEFFEDRSTEKLIDGYCKKYNQSLNFYDWWEKCDKCIIDTLQSENAALRERLEKAVELPVKVGDTVYFIPTYNRKPIWGVQRGIVQMVGITRQGYHVKIRDRSDFNKTYMFRKSAFLSKEQAEARLAELQGEEKNG